MSHSYKSSKDAFNISWYARNFGMDRRTVSGRIKRASLREANVRGKGQFYYVSDVAPLLVLARLNGELQRLSRLVRNGRRV